MDIGPLRSLGLGVAGAALLGLIGSAAGGTAVAARVGVTAALPASGHVGSAVRVPGRATYAPAAAIAELERQAAGQRWVRLATAAIRQGRFMLAWVPATPGFLRVRVVVLRRRALLAATAPSTLLVGAAPVYCAAPTGLPSVPAGDGTIIGGVYNAGGPAPGIYACQGQTNTVTLTSAAGTVVTQQVAAGGSYAFVAAPGSYGLSAGYRRGTATVTAGGTTHADTVCDVP